MKVLFNKMVAPILFGLSLLLVSPVSAQNDAEALNIAEFLKAGSADASKLMGQYLNPVFKGFGYGANGGWYNTAKAHKSLGFDLTVTTSLAKAPQSEYFFNFNEEDYINVQQVGTGSGSTLFGDPEGSVRLSSEFEEQGQTITTEFEAPPGINYKFNDFDGSKFRGWVPFFMVQGGIGLFKNTDLKVRWMPTINAEFEDTKFTMGMFGLGLMHDFKQWIPGIKHIPFDMSLFVGYNRIYSTLEIPEGGISGSDQTAEFGVNSLTYQVLVSKKLSVLTLYAGGGYNNASTTLKVLGTYEIEDEFDSDFIVLTDPVNEKFTSQGWRGTIGMRLLLAVISIHVDYTFQEYNTLTAGLGVSIR